MSHTEVLSHIQRNLDDLVKAKGGSIGTIAESTVLLGGWSHDRLARPRHAHRPLRVNLLGAIEMARAASQVLLRQNSGGRINVSSIIGSRGYNGLVAYSASKAGLDGLTRALARELGRRRITVNSVAPGYLRTEMSSTLTVGQLAKIVNRTPFGRLATENDVVGLVMFLLSEEAAFITGQTIMVDGGISA